MISRNYVDTKLMVNNEILELTKQKQTIKRTWQSHFRMHWESNWCPQSNLAILIIRQFILSWSRTFLSFLGVEKIIKILIYQNYRIEKLWKCRIYGIPWYCQFSVRHRYEILRFFRPLYTDISVHIEIFGIYRKLR